MRDNCGPVMAFCLSAIGIGVHGHVSCTCRPQSGPGPRQELLFEMQQPRLAHGVLAL
jgi:hypothetical protein